MHAKQQKWGFRGTQGTPLDPPLQIIMWHCILRTNMSSLHSVAKRCGIRYSINDTLCPTSYPVMLAAAFNTPLTKLDTTEDNASQWQTGREETKWYEHEFKSIWRSNQNYRNLILTQSKNRSNFEVTFACQIRIALGFIIQIQRLSCFVEIFADDLSFFIWMT